MAAAVAAEVVAQVPVAAILQVLTLHPMEVAMEVAMVVITVVTIARILAFMAILMATTIHMHTMEMVRLRQNALQKILSVLQIKQSSSETP